MRPWPLDEGAVPVVGLSCLAVGLLQADAWQQQCSLACEAVLEAA